MTLKNRITYTKIACVVIPVIFTWATWVTAEIYAGRSFRLAGDRFTAADGVELQLEIEHRQEEKWTALEIRLDSIAARQAKILASIESLRR